MTENPRVNNEAQQSPEVESEPPAQAEQPADQPQPEKITEKNKVTIQDFDVETRRIEGQKADADRQINQRENLLATNVKMAVPDSINKGLSKDIEDLRKQRDELSADLGKRGPSETEQMISGEVKKIEDNIKRIKDLESQDPFRVPSQIMEGRKKEIEGLEKQRAKMVEEADIAKVEKIEKYRKEAGAVKSTEEVNDQETPKEKREKAVEILSNPKVMERSPEEIADAFKEVTGNELIEEREKMVEKNLAERHMIVLRGKAAIEKHRQERTEVEQERILEENHNAALETLWKRNPNVKEEDRGRYLYDTRKKLGLLSADGGDIALDKLINDGYAVEKAKTGWFSGKVKIPQIGGKAVLVYDNKKDLFEQTVSQAEAEALAGAKMRADARIKAGYKILAEERAACTKNIIEQTIGNHVPEKPAKKVQNTTTEARAVEKQEQQVEYVSSSDIIDKVHALGGRTRGIVSPELMEIINKGQPRIDMQKDVSAEEWNEIMAAKEKGNQQMKEWIEKKLKKQVQGKSKPKKTRKKNNEVK